MQTTHYSTGDSLPGHKKRKLEDKDTRSHLSDQGQAGTMGAQEQQTASRTQVPQTSNQHPTLWYEDGHVEVHALDGMQFKLHPGILSRHSEVLKDLLETAELRIHGGNASSTEHILRLDEHGASLALFFEVIYDGGNNPFISFERTINFLNLRAILLLAIKYKVQHIIDCGILRLRALFPARYEDWTDWPLEGASYPVKMTAVDSIAVVALARAVNCPELLPAALYVCSSLPAPTIVDGTSYGLERVVLAREDRDRCLAAQPELLRMRSRITRIILEGAHPRPTARASEDPEWSKDFETLEIHHCAPKMQRLALKALDDQIFTASRCFDSLRPWIETTAKCHAKLQLCDKCEQYLIISLKERMTEEWDKLGAVFGVADLLAA